MKRLTQISALTAIAVTIGILTTGGQAQQGDGGNGIQAKDCKISLKYSAILAGERVGILRTIEFEEGQPVRKGAIVATLNDEIAVAALKKAEKEASNDVQVRYAAKVAEVANQELKVAQAANDRINGVVPAVEIKKLELAAQRGTLQIEQAQFEQDIAKIAVDEAVATKDSYQVKAPFDGFVRKIHRKVGEAVRQGDPIIEVYSESHMLITGDVTIGESYQISSGDAVKVRLRLEDEDLAIENVWLDGRILVVDPEGSSILKRVKVIAEVENKKFNDSKYILTAGLDATMWINPGSGRAAKKD